MTTAITFIIIYLAGYLLSFNMQKIEHEAEGKVYTKGDRTLNFILSLLSFVMILIILLSAWIRKIAATGYWNRPVVENAPIAETKTTVE